MTDPDEPIGENHIFLDGKMRLVGSDMSDVHWDSSLNYPYDEPDGPDLTAAVQPEEKPDPSTMWTGFLRGFND